MADTYLTVVIKLEGRDETNFPGLSGTSATRTKGLTNLLNRIDAGLVQGKVAYAVHDDSGTNANGTIACLVATVTTADTVTFEWGGDSTVLTAGTDFVIGATDTELGANLATGINEHPVLRTFLTAAAVTGTVTVTFDCPGQVGHDVDMSTNDAVAFTLTQIGAGVAGDPSSSVVVLNGVDKT